MTSTTPSPSAAPSATPAGRGNSSAIGLTHAALGEHDRALEWIDQSRRRCLRETDTYVAMHAAILDTEATISAAEPTRPGPTRPDAHSFPSPRAATWTTSSPEAYRS